MAARFEHRGMEPGRLDNIIVTPSIGINAVRLGTEVLSDHIPLLAELTFSPES